MNGMLLLPSKLTQSEVAVNSKINREISWQDQARLANWKIDAQNLVKFDSSVLALLLELRRFSEASEGVFEIYNPPAKLMQLAILYGVSELLNPKPSN